MAHALTCSDWPPTPQTPAAPGPPRPAAPAAHTPHPSARVQRRCLPFLRTHRLRLAQSGLQGALAVGPSGTTSPQHCWGQCLLGARGSQYQCSHRHRQRCPRLLPCTAHLLGPLQLQQWPKGVVLALLFRLPPPLPQMPLPLLLLLLLLLLLPHCSRNTRAAARPWPARRPLCMCRPWGCCCRAGAAACCPGHLCSARRTVCGEGAWWGQGASSWGAYVCVCVRICVCTCVCKCVHTCVCTSVCLQVCVCVCVCVQACACGCVCMYGYGKGQDDKARHSAGSAERPCQGRGGGLCTTPCDGVGCIHRQMRRILTCACRRARAHTPTRAYTNPHTRARMHIMRVNAGMRVGHLSPRGGRVCRAGAWCSSGVRAT